MVDKYDRQRHKNYNRNKYNQQEIITTNELPTLPQQQNRFNKYSRSQYYSNNNEPNQIQYQQY